MVSDPEEIKHVMIKGFTHFMDRPVSEMKIKYI